MKTRDFFHFIKMKLIGVLIFFPKKKKMKIQDLTYGSNHPADHRIHSFCYSTYVFVDLIQTRMSKNRK